MKRLISLLAVLACLLAAFAAPFASADDTAADAAQLPDHIVNGDSNTSMIGSGSMPHMVGRR